MQPPEKVESDRGGGGCQRYGERGRKGKKEVRHEEKGGIEEVKYIE
jgi:hypothetical protein